MRVEWAEGRDAFGALEGAWASPAAAEPHPFADHAWLAAWHEAFGAGARLRCALAWRGDDLAAAFPLLARGRRLAAPANYHSPIFAVPAQDDEARAAVIDAAVSGARELAVHAVAAGGPTLATLRATGKRLLDEPAHASPIVVTGGDAEAWTTARGSTLRRRRRKLEREHEVVLRLDTTTDALERGFELEGSGWKVANGTAIVSQPETRGFYTAVAEAYAARGELVQGWLDVDGKPVAWHFTLRRGDRLYMLKTGYDEAAKALAPGLVLHLLTAEHCFGSDVTAYELLGDVERWKLELSTAEREHRRVWLYGASPPALGRWAARRWGAPLARAARDRFSRG